MQAIRSVPNRRRSTDVFSSSSLALRAIPLACVLLASSVHAQQAGAASGTDQKLQEVVVSASRGAQNRFDAPAAVDAVSVDGFTAQSPLVNLSELMGAVPGVQVRNRENYAQDLQVSVRGFGTRSTFGVRGVRILVDGIPATMPDGQGQAATAQLASAQRIEVLRGPVAQLYGNAAGGVLQVFTKDPPITHGRPEIGFSAGFGSDNQRDYGVSLGAGTKELGGTIDVSRFTTDGYRDHSAAERNQLNAKIVGRPSDDTTITGIVNFFDQPLSQDPLGLTRAQFDANPRQVIPGAIQYDTRKTIRQNQIGFVVDHTLSANDSLSGRIYTGTRSVFQTLAFSGGNLDKKGFAASAGGVVDLDRSYGGIGLNWTHKTQVNGLPLRWVVGVEGNEQLEARKGYVNNNGTPGAVRRDEDDTARDTGLFGQLNWTFAPKWEALAGVRVSEVKLSVADHYFGDNYDGSGAVSYHNTSPVVGLVFHATDDINVYANIGKGFETPTLAEAAYQANGTGTNFALKPSTSVQSELGVKMRAGRHTFDAALFNADSRDEIVAASTDSGRTIYQNVDKARRRGVELAWKADWKQFTTKVAYTLLQATFRNDFTGTNGSTVAAGNRLPGAPMHSLFAEAETHLTPQWTAAVEGQVNSKVYVNDVNSEAAPGYALINLRTGYAFDFHGARMFAFGRIDNLFDRSYAGSVIVNDSNGRFYEPAPGRRLFVGLRTQF